MSRWVLTEVDTSATWTMPINPDGMTSPHAPKSLTFAKGQKRGIDRVRTFKQATPAHEWEWSGVIRSQVHYETLELWAKKPGLIRVSDHLGRTWEVIISSFEPEDRRPTPGTPWRMRYTMKCLLLRRAL